MEQSTSPRPLDADYRVIETQFASAIADREAVDQSQNERQLDRFVGQFLLRLARN